MIFRCSPKITLFKHETYLFSYILYIIFLERQWELAVYRVPIPVSCRLLGLRVEMLFFGPLHMKLLFCIPSVDCERNQLVQKLFKYGVP